MILQIKKHLSIIALLMITAIQFSCSNNDSSDTPIVDPPAADDTFIRASDVSYLPEMEERGTKFYSNGKAEDMLTTLRNAGCNTVRIRLWNNPSNGHSGFAEVKKFAQRIKQSGLRVWLTVHYSDHWADPGVQTTPEEWKNLSFTDLKTAVSNYTSKIITEINPDIIQIGNEINSGLLWPQGNLISNEQQCIDILKTASATVRAKAPNTKIMIHYAGINAGGTDWFFNKMKTIDYDYIGLSYYPVWHGKDISQVKTIIDALGKKYSKRVLIAETAYPFTLSFNDFTNNIVGAADQLVPNYPATPAGQRTFVMAVRAQVKASEYGQGFAYWGGEWVAFKGQQATSGSTFENQALYSFDNNALSVMQAFSKD